jgi:hypothetical protein
VIDQSFARPGAGPLFARAGAALRSWRWTILVYLGSRVLLIAVALAAAATQHI